MITKLIRDKVYCGLDIGSQRIKASLLSAVDPDTLDLIGVYESKTKGFKESSVSDLGVLSECIHNAIGSLTKKTGVKVKDVHIGVGGEFIEKRENTTVIPLLDRGSKVIGSYDIRKINNQARLLGVKVEEEIIHNFPQYYCVDDVNTALNPIGLLGRKLEVKSILIVSNVTRLRNITKAVNQAGYDVAKTFFTSYSSATVALNDRMKEDGVVLLDIGARVTDVIVFKNRSLKFLDKIPLGGDHITHAISLGLNIPFDLAEDIKKSYAICLNGDPKMEEEILVKRNAAYMPIKRADIFRSMTGELEKLTQAIRESLNRSNIVDQINQGIVMVGGGALLTGLVERVEQSVNLPTKLGKVRVGTKALSNAAIFSSAVGLAKVGVNSFHKNRFSPNGYTNKVNYVFNKVREFYQEYF